MAKPRGVEGPEQQVAQAVDQLRTRFGWQLIEGAEFVRLAAEHMRVGGFTKPSEAAFNLYTLTLYDACAGTQGAARREAAYGELARYLYDIARNRYHEADPDLVNEALAEIFEHFGDCRVPGAFLAFAQQRLRDLVRRRWNSRTVSLDAQHELLSAEGDDGLSEALSAELRTQILDYSKAFLDKHRGAQMQFLAVWLKFMRHLDDSAIATQLGKDTRQVHLLRCRGLKKLRQDPAWQALAAELGFPSVERG
jgi:DNA-directed RNA polymerase specialized sigma24 family protein